MIESGLPDDNLEKNTCSCHSWKSPHLVISMPEGCQSVCSMAVFPNLGPPDVLGLQLPEILTSRGGGEGFWEF